MHSCPANAVYLLNYSVATLETLMCTGFLCIAEVVAKVVYRSTCTRAQSFMGLEGCKL